jgi:hypothetical protein
VRLVKKSSGQSWTRRFPLYLTLSGAGGRDIELMIQRRIIRQSEVGGIALEDMDKVVAVESHPDSVLALQKQFPGLKILQVPFHNLIRSTNPLRWPQGEDEKCCRAHVINLDLNEPLQSAETGGHITFPILQWIQKLAQIHAASPHTDWYLCLTLHGEIPWSREVGQDVQSFLAENCRLEPMFAKECQKLLGNDLFRRILESHDVALDQLEQASQQKVLMAFVPKKISQLVLVQGWRVITSRNIRYGGGRRAPIVSWIFNFNWDTRVSSTPNIVYLECLKSVLAKRGYIAENGHLS